ncbi:MAG: hypothetical protein ACTSWW_09135 [Promethearchaeota archaeon]
MNCTELAGYVLKNCGGCNYNWTIHKTYIEQCRNGIGIECANWCGTEILNKLHYGAIIMVIIACVLLFTWWVMRMNEKKIVFAFVGVGLLLLWLKIQYLVETEKVAEMERICSEKYNLEYSHHDNYHFWCVNYSWINFSELTIETVKVQWNDEWHRLFEPPPANLNTSISA